MLCFKKLPLEVYLIPGTKTEPAAKRNNKHDKQRSLSFLQNIIFVRGERLPI